MEWSVIRWISGVGYNMDYVETANLLALEQGDARYDDLLKFKDQLRKSATN